MNLEVNLYIYSLLIFDKDKNYYKKAQTIIFKKAQNYYSTIQKMVPWKLDIHIKKMKLQPHQSPFIKNQLKMVADLIVAPETTKILE